MAFALANVQRSTIDAWLEAVRNVVTNWPEHQPFRVIFDFAFSNVAFTPYMRARIKDTSSMLDDLRTSADVRVAIILTPSARALIGILFASIQSQIRANAGSNISRIFVNYDSALSWLHTSQKL